MQLPQHDPSALRLIRRMRAEAQAVRRDSTLPSLALARHLDQTALSIISFLEAEANGDTALSYDKCSRCHGTGVYGNEHVDEADCDCWAAEREALRLEAIADEIEFQGAE